MSRSETADPAAVPAFRRIADAFAAEGVEACFALLGDGNMNFCAAMAERPNLRMIYARHEQCAVAMAIAYARSSGRMGVASVTCGPGVTQIGTALSVAARARVPLLVFAGETPAGVLLRRDPHLCVARHAIGFVLRNIDVDAQTIGLLQVKEFAGGRR